jgi:hypothetical protein
LASVIGEASRSVEAATYQHVGFGAESRSFYSDTPASTARAATATTMITHAVRRRVGAGAWRMRCMEGSGRWVAIVPRRGFRPTLERNAAVEAERAREFAAISRF